MPYTIEDFLGTTHSLNTLLKMNEKPRKMKFLNISKLKTYPNFHHILAIVFSLFLQSGLFLKTRKNANEMQNATDFWG